MSQSPSVAAAPAPNAPAAESRRTNPWIIGAGRDLALIIASPFLVLPLFALARGKLGLETLALYIAAFGALGHHFPGMLRAYGDRELFQRFKVRFLVSPVLLVAGAIACAFLDLDALGLTVLVWGVWHGAMQTYGFARIYDAKAGSFETRTQRLDLALCLSWFITAVLVSPVRMYGMIHVYHVSAGGPLPPMAVLDGIQIGAVAVTAVITLLYIAHVIATKRAGRAVSMVKLGLLVTSIGCWCLAVVFIRNVIVGVALFEIFHDIQYLTIVWVFNRGRVERNGGAGSFTRFLFRRSGVFIGLYVGLVAAYGSLRLVEGGMQQESIKKVLTGVLVASTLLHFYYDGFIWKVREAQTSAALGIDRGRGLFAGSWRFAHAAKWAPLVLVLILLSLRQVDARKSNFERLSTLEQSMPDNPELQRSLGDAARQLGRPDEALTHYRAAVEHGAESSGTFFHLGSLLAARGEHDEAVDYLQRAVALKPSHVEAFRQLGDVWIAKRMAPEAEQAYRRALALEPDMAAAHHGLAQALSGLGDFEAGAAEYREALRLAPDSLPSLHGLGVSLTQLQRLDEAAEAYIQVLNVNPGFQPSLLNLALIEESRGRLDEAEAHLRRYVELRPGDPAAAQHLERVLATQRQNG